MAFLCTHSLSLLLPLFAPTPAVPQVFGLLVWTLIAGTEYFRVPAFGWVMFVAVFYWVLTVFFLIVYITMTYTRIPQVPWTTVVRLLQGLHLPRAMSWGGKCLLVESGSPLLTWGRPEWETRHRRTVDDLGTSQFSDKLSQGKLASVTCKQMCHNTMAPNLPASAHTVLCMTIDKGVWQGLESTHLAVRDYLDPSTTVKHKESECLPTRKQEELGFGFCLGSRPHGI